MSERFAIVPERWYAFTMFPGYTDSPYASPIYVHTAEPLGGRRLRLEFLNAAYAEGVQHFVKVLRTLKRASLFWVAEETEEPDRVVVVHDISPRWLLTHFSGWASDLGQGEDVQAYLNGRFGLGHRDNG